MPRIPATSAILAVVLASAARADEAGTRTWTAYDTLHEIAFAATLAIDYSQTRWALRSEQYEETNPILGRRPSRSKLMGLACAGITIHAGVSYLLPAPWRRYWQVAALSYEASAVAHNAVVVGGIRLAF